MCTCKERIDPEQYAIDNIENMKKLLEAYQILQDVYVHRDYNKQGDIIPMWLSNRVEDFFRVE